MNTETTQTETTPAAPHQRLREAMTKFYGSAEIADLLLQKIPYPREEPRWRTESVGNLYAALAKAQGQFGTAVKDRKAEVEGRDGKRGFSYGYATLASVMEATLPALSANGLAVIQLPYIEGNKVTIQTILGHAQTGEEIRNHITMLAQDATPQKIGSCLTYAKRYAWMSIVGIAPDEDDDGNQAQGNDARIERRPPPASRPQAAPAAAPPPASAPPKQAAKAQAASPLTPEKLKQMVDGCRTAAEVDRLARMHKAFENGELHDYASARWDKLMTEERLGARANGEQA